MKQCSVYNCPRCSRRTCSLACCQAHKERTGCNGKRQRTEFLPLCRMTDATLRNDYFFLEDVLNQTSNIKRQKNTTNAAGGKQHLRSPRNDMNRRKRLANIAHQRGIKFQVMPPVMERHRANTSWYNSKTNVITWKVDVVILPMRTTITCSISEQETNILSVIMSAAAAVTEAAAVTSSVGIQAALQGKAGSSCYGVYMARLPSQANRPRYLRVDDPSTTSLRQVLQGQTIIEYPTLYLVPDDLAHEFPIGTDKIEEIRLSPFNE